MKLLLSSKSTLAALLAILSAIIVLNMFYSIRIFKRLSSIYRQSEQERIRLIKTNILYVLYVGILSVVVLFEFLSIASVYLKWLWPVVISSFGMSIILLENLWADIYGNQGRHMTPTGGLGIVVSTLIIVLGFVIGLKLSLANIDRVYRLTDLSRSWWSGMVISIVGIVIAYGLVVYPLIVLQKYTSELRAEQDHITDESPAHNILQNIGQYWAIHQFVVIPSALYVYRIHVLLSNALNPEAVIALLYGYTAIVATFVAVPLRNNYLHKRDLEKRKRKYKKMFKRISGHITFQTIWTAYLVISVATWLWFQAINSMLVGS